MFQQLLKRKKNVKYSIFFENYFAGTTESADVQNFKSKTVNIYKINNVYFGIIQERH